MSHSLTVAVKPLEIIQKKPSAHSESVEFPKAEQSENRFLFLFLLKHKRTKQNSKPVLLARLSQPLDQSFKGQLNVQLVAPALSSQRGGK